VFIGRPIIICVVCQKIVEVIVDWRLAAVDGQDFNYWCDKVRIGEYFSVTWH